MGRVAFRSRWLLVPVVPLAAATWSCSPHDDTYVEGTVGPARVCARQWNRMSPVAVDANGRQHTLDDEEARDLGKLAWGSEHQVTLRLRTYKKSWAGLGGTSVRVHRIKKSASKEGARLALPVDAACLTPDRRAFVDGQRFECSSPEVCRALDEEVARMPRSPFELVVQFQKGEDAPLVVEAVRTREEKRCAFYPCAP